MIGWKKPSIGGRVIHHSDVLKGTVPLVFPPKNEELLNLKLIDREKFTAAAMTWHFIVDDLFGRDDEDDPGPKWNVCAKGFEWFVSNGFLKFDVRDAEEDEDGEESFFITVDYWSFIKGVYRPLHPDELDNDDTAIWVGMISYYGDSN